MNILNYISIASLPAILLVIITYAFFKKKNVYDDFLSGSKDSISSIIKIFPSLLGLTIALSVFRDSGALDFVIQICSPLFTFIGVPVEIVPLIFLRPISGSGSLAILSSIMTQYGVDTFIGKLACVIMGSTETILYTFTIYLGCIGIKKTKYTLFPVIIADLIGVFIAISLFKYFS